MITNFCIVKKNINKERVGGIQPIARGEVLYWLVSRAFC